MDFQIHQLSQAEQLLGGVVDGDAAHSGAGHVVLHGVAPPGQRQRVPTHMFTGHSSCSYVDDVTHAGNKQQEIFVVLARPPGITNSDKVIQ